MILDIEHVALNFGAFGYPGVVTVELLDEIGFILDSYFIQHSKMNDYQIGISPEDELVYRINKEAIQKEVQQVIKELVQDYMLESLNSRESFVN